MSRWNITGSTIMQKNEKCSEIVFLDSKQNESSLCEPWCDGNSWRCDDSCCDNECDSCCDNECDSCCDNE